MPMSLDRCGPGTLERGIGKSTLFGCSALNFARIMRTRASRLLLGSHGDELGERGPS